MQAKIISEKKMLLIGMNFYGDPFSNHSFWSEENEIGHLWKRFISFLDKNPELNNRIKKNVFLEIFLTSEESMSAGLFDVFVGILVDKLEYIPINCVAKQLPATEYAVFTLKGNQINSDWQKKIYKQWLPESDYELSFGYNIQYYDQRFKGINSIRESELDILVPVRKKS